MNSARPLRHRHPQPAGDAAGDGHPVHRAAGFHGGILGLQAKRPAAGEGLHRGCLAGLGLGCPMDVPEVVLEQKRVLSSSSESCARRRGGWGSREQDGSCRSFVPPEIGVQSPAQLPGRGFAVLGHASSSRAVRPPSQAG